MTERYTWELRETKLGEVQVVVDNTKEDCWYGTAMSICEILNCKEERIKELEEENEKLRMKLKGDDYIMVSEMLSNLRKTDICDGCKNKDKPVEWYLERGFSITGRVCDRYEPEV